MDFETKGMEPKGIKIAVEKIVPSLATYLYGDDWRIPIRELLQNCHDAISEGILKGIRNDESLRIDIIPDPSRGTLTFKDNGIGMTLGDVEKNLATIGTSGKREEITAVQIS